MRSKFFLVLFFVVGGAVFVYWCLVGGEQSGHRIRQAVRQVNVSPEEGMDLSLKGIELSQGEQGEELWRLKAQTAFYVQEEDVVQLGSPEITYFLQPEMQKIFIQANKGVIDQKSQKARLLGDVVIQRQQGTIRCDLVIFDGNAKKLTMPGSVTFDETDLVGTATDVVWSLEENIIHADKNVSMNVFVQQESLGSDGAENNGSE